MELNKKKVPSDIEIDAPINFEIIKREVTAHGPLRLSKHPYPYEVIIEPAKCQCSYEDCTAELVIVKRKSGLFEINWLISREEFEEFESLNDFKNYVVLGGFHDSRGESLIVEQSISKYFGKSYHEVEPFCACSDCAEEMGESVFANMVILSNLGYLLKLRDDFIAEAEEWDLETANPQPSEHLEDSGEEEQESLRDWVADAIELGYSIGRHYSEFAVKSEIEPLALQGMNAKAVKKKREAAAGEKSRELRVNRRANLFKHVETLAIRNPDIVKLLGADGVAKLALKECKEENPAMWKQGPGQVSEYLGEIRRGDAGRDMQKRYQALFGDKPPKRFKGLG